MNTNTYKTTTQTVTLVLGLPGAGKSTYVAWERAKGKLPGTLLRFDALRKAMGHEYHPGLEPMVNAVACVMLRTALLQGESVVVDESITTLHVAQELVAAAKENNAQVHMLFLTTPLETCMANRIPNGFPLADFQRKLREWDVDGQRILALADMVEMQEQQGAA
ncbi:AAA family ATPase [Desulfovibrio cuneatus]|uniref:AAA family ATPase n=1 Tax=Desulfovibrio cuneatus TaxID=159728 RepID=UPI0003FF4307|nr:AAA family ATPase [Desulfovibrio cuneatus]